MGTDQLKSEKTGMRIKYCNNYELRGAPKSSTGQQWFR
jgi:hypothetical protein